MVLVVAEHFQGVLKHIDWVLSQLVDKNVDIELLVSPVDLK